MAFIRVWSFSTLLLALALASCGSDDARAISSSDGDKDVPSGAVCPTTSTLTYDNFGKDLMERSCTACHSSTLRDAASRQDAPQGYDFDTLAGIQADKRDIDIEAAASTRVVNDHMPPIGAKRLDGSTIPAPTLEERQQLGEWLACGAN